MAMLLRTEDVARSADFKVTHGNLKAGAEFGIFPYCRKSSVRYFRQFLATLKREICRRSACASADSSAYLMKLSESEPVGVLDNQRIAIRNIDARLNNGGAN